MFVYTFTCAMYTSNQPDWMEKVYKCMAIEHAILYTVYAWTHHMYTMHTPPSDQGWVGGVYTPMYTLCSRDDLSPHVHHVHFCAPQMT